MNKIHRRQSVLPLGVAVSLLHRGGEVVHQLVVELQYRFDVRNAGQRPDTVGRTADIDDAAGAGVLDQVWLVIGQQTTSEGMAGDGV